MKFHDRKTTSPGFVITSKVRKKTVRKQPSHQNPTNKEIKKITTKSAMTAIAVPYVQEIESVTQKGGLIDNAKTLICEEPHTD